MVAALKKARAATHVGNLRDLRPLLSASEQSLTTLRQQVANASDGFTLDVDALLATGDFTRELLETAERMNVRVYEQDDRLYCYPSLIRILPNDKAVLIDKARERRLRPSVLVAHLREVQRKPPRFRPEAFLESLLNAYSAVVAARGQDLFGTGVVARLTEIYDLLTLLPGQTREYSKQEFARDVYLLDRSGVTTTRKGHRVSLPANSGTRAGGSVVRVITEDGADKLYYGIAFSAGSGSA